MVHAGCQQRIGVTVNAVVPQLVGNAEALKAAASDVGGVHGRTRRRPSPRCRIRLPRCRASPGPKSPCPSRWPRALHWALGQVTPPTLQGAMQGENGEKRDENLRLLYVACTRAMELLVIPD